MTDQTQPTKTSRTVGILAFDAMEVLDYAGPYEVFQVAGEVAAGSFEVQSLALRPGNVAARGGFTVVPDAVYDAVAVPDIVIVPGGLGTRALLDDAELLKWLATTASEAEILASVCTGSLLFAAAGLLANRRAITHHMALDRLAEISPSTEIVSDQRFVAAGGNLWTSGGISAGIDMSLAITAHLLGAAVRDQVVAVMEWGWHPETNSGRTPKSRS